MPMPDHTLDINGLDGPLGQRVYSALRTGILEMALKPGEVLRKGALCDQLGVSRSPVAEALGRLSSDGLVDIIPQSATRVSQFSLAELLEEHFLREAVEVAAVARVANERTDEQLTRLSRNLRYQTLLIEDEDFQGFFEADLEFHELILSFTGFPKVNQVAEEMTLQLRRARKLILPEPGRPAQAVAEHQEIFKAIEAKDVDAARSTMAQHLRQMTKRIVPLEREHPEYFRTT
ncbi:GntR family transcriptional regulator [Litoreibacter janthinus]|uniref:Transcriptional regulator, GntR family n=1 Tax=Litoreibacter janthinus TaxID=670154 RepID=A0A1I6HIA4_9RHOB|nr:GntR family transcriptional regulator [Litoreibacter janthinus]SFR54084.1 transcriptional regulator, GntR family [Litoreibacter janthinus]